MIQPIVPPASSNVHTSRLRIAGAGASCAPAVAGNSSEALWTLGILYAIVPALTGLLTAWVIRGYRLDSATHAEIRRQLDERAAAARIDEAAENPESGKSTLATI